MLSTHDFGFIPQGLFLKKLRMFYNTGQQISFSSDGTLNRVSGPRKLRKVIEATVLHFYKIDTTELFEDVPGTTTEDGDKKAAKQYK